MRKGVVLRTNDVALCANDFYYFKQSKYAVFPRKMAVFAKQIVIRY